MAFIIGSQSSLRLVHCLCLFSDNWYLHWLFLACGLHWLRGSWSCTIWHCFWIRCRFPLRRRMGRNSSNKTVTLRNPIQHPPSQFFFNKFHLPSEASYSFSSTFRSCFFIIFFFEPVFHKLRVIFMCWRIIRGRIYLSASQRHHSTDDGL